MIRVTAPVAAELAAHYRAQGWWNSRLLRDGIESAPPDSLALADADTTLTYGEVTERVNAAIAWLQRAGVRECAILVAGNTVAAAVAYHALLRIGATVIVLDRRCGPADLALARSTGGPGAAVVAPAAELDRLQTGGLDLAALMAAPAAAPAAATAWPEPFWPEPFWPEPFWPEPDRDRPAVVLFTSGTTSRPKGVIHSLNTLTAGAQNMAVLSGASAHTKAYLVSPLTSIAGIVQLHLCADQHGTLILDDAFEPHAALARINRHGATLLGGAPVIVERLFSAAQDKVIALRTLALGGAALPRPLLARAIDDFGIEVVRVYGSSEAPNHTASLAGDDRDARLADDGALLPGSQVRLGAGGEGLVRGPARFLGYTDPADNEDAFEDGWFRTGDALELNGSRVAVVGRLKEIVNRAGLKISLAEIDAALAGLPGAVEAAAFAVPDAQTGERLAVAVTGSATSLAEVVAHLRASGLAARKLPEEVVWWHDPLPRTPSGKVVRARLASESIDRPHELAARRT